MSTTPTLADVLGWLDSQYPPEWAEPWDAVGLVCGRTQAQVARILLAVDPTPAVVSEAIAAKADLLVTHHPLFLQGVHSVAATSWKGSVIHDLISADVALHCAHTNADVAPGGVSDALAELLELENATVLSPSSTPDAATAGAGLGRWGTLKSPATLADLARRVSDRLPTTANGLHVAGDPDRLVTRVGVCGGAGDSLIDYAAALDLDVFVTADLRHHVVLESRLRSDMSFVGVSHWASEWPWLPRAGTRLVAAAEASGATVEVVVSEQVTDPWDH